MKKTISIFIAALLLVTFIVPFTTLAAVDTVGTASAAGRANVIIKVYDKETGAEMTTYTPGTAKAVEVRILNAFTGFDDSEALATYQIITPNSTYISYSNTVARATQENLGASYEYNSFIWGNTSYGYKAGQSLYGYIANDGRAYFKPVFEPALTMNGFASILAKFDATISAEAEGDLTFDLYQQTTISGSTYFGKNLTVGNKANIYQWTSTPAVLTEATTPGEVSAEATFGNKTEVGTTYNVTLTDTVAGSSYKVYAYDEVYGWSLAKAYGTETTFDIVVAHPTNPLKLEVLSTDDVRGREEGSPTVELGFAAMGQLDATASLNKTSFALGETITLDADVLPADKAATYQVSFGDSRTIIRGDVVDGTISATAAAAKPGSYKAVVTVVAADNESNYVSKTINYTVVDVTAPTTTPEFTAKLSIPVITVGNAFDVTLPSMDKHGTTGETYSYHFASAITGGESYYFGSRSTATITKPGVYHAYADVLVDGVIADTTYTKIRVERTSGKVTLDNLAVVNNSGTYEFTVAATNATEYLFVRFDEAGYRTVRSWSSDNTWTWTPERDGTYNILVYVKGAGAGSYEDSREYLVTVGDVAGAVAPTFTVANKTAGAASTISVTNPAAGYVYAFEIYDPLSNKYTYSEYLAAGETSFEYVAAKARDYRVTVFTKLADNSGAYDAKTTQTISYN